MAGRVRRSLIAAVLVASLGGCQTAPVSSPLPTRSPSPSVGPSATVGPSPTADIASGIPGCTPPDHPEWSVARRWDAALLDAIRRSLPNPPVHARNLFHMSVAMWDAWATYDDAARGYVTTSKVHAAHPDQARNEAISYAAWTVLRARFKKAIGAVDSLAEFDAVLASLCYPTTAAATGPSADPASVGLRIGQAVLDHGLTDGSNEAGGYKDPDYKPVNAPLVVASAKRFTLVDPSRWQPLEIVGGFSQNGIPTGTIQVAVAPQWGRVEAFGATSLADGTPLDPGPPPRLGDPTSDSILKQQLVEVIRDSSALDPANRATIDISPAARGNNDLATNDGYGYQRNPVTGAAYASEIVKVADFERAAAEFWADGPRSETPPGHWNVIANDASDAIASGRWSTPANGPEKQFLIAGKGAGVDRLEWDVKLYLAVNAAVHNAAIVAWGLKGKYDSVRPISLIRYMGGLGQSSDQAGPSYDPRGLPLVPGVIEVVTPGSSAIGQRHHALAHFIGRVVIRSWGGTPSDPKTEVAGAHWMLATAWVPYQLPTFVTPSFPGYASGHSTFSRAAAEVLAGFTGSAYFPGGLASYLTPAGGLAFEHGPTTDVNLEWATYYDASDQAGQSRLFGGIHIQADDFTGRHLGSLCGRAAWQLAQGYYAGVVDAAARACVPGT
jgi:hypothetical protein